MNFEFLMILGIFIIIYGLIHYYIGLRGWQFVNGWLSNPKLRWYWIIFVVFLSISYPLGRFLADVLPHDPGRIMIVFGSYWLAIMYYLIILLLAIDVILWLDRWTGILPTALKNTPAIVGLSVIIVVTAIVGYGTWNANHPVIKNYEVTLNKKSANLEKLQVVVVSDIHLGWINGVRQMQLMTDMVNELNPDLVLLPGDIIDEGIDLSTEQKIPQLLRTLHPELGTYAIMGNHEYISGNADKVDAYLKMGGVTVLRDEWVRFNSFYLIGRDDQSSNHYRGSSPQRLSAVMEGIEKDKLPILLMEHQPSNLEIAEQAGIDLQLSGHTHRGQIWPNNYITQGIFEKDWGYLRKNNLQLIVSCGYGTWGPPIRIGNQPEILNIHIKFEPSAL